MRKNNKTVSDWGELNTFAYPDDSDLNRQAKCKAGSVKAYPIVGGEEILMVGKELFFYE